jgi:hypothetical protein
MIELQRNSIVDSGLNLLSQTKLDSDVISRNASSISLFFVPWTPDSTPVSPASPKHHDSTVPVVSAMEDKLLSPPSPIPIPLP